MESRQRKLILICMGYPSHPKMSILSQPSLLSLRGG